MEYLIDYGLFLAKTATIVFAIILILGAIASAGQRQRKDGKKGSLKITELNSHYEDIRDDLRQEVLSKEEYKQLQKQEKKAEKAERKAEKQAVKQADSDAELAVERKPRTYVLNFKGNIGADAVASLREEITAVLSLAEISDSVMLRLESPGGMVHAYGLASSQLVRIKNQQIPLTICVDKVAASGGYMMACVADKIVASPFAVLGSIGVISDVPNVYERLKNEGIEFATITAGKYKRTITPTKKITKEDLIKTTKDIEDVLTLFKGFVSTNRPSLNIDEVATGETWFGPDAMKRGLCDELKTSDDVLLDLVSTCEIFSVKLTTPSRSPLAFAGVGASNAFSSWGLLATLASAAAKYAQANGGANFLPPNANASNGGMGFQAIDREVDTFMMLDQSYGNNMNASGMMDFDFDDGILEEDDVDTFEL